MSDSARPDTEIDARVLGRLILVESALHALPDVDRIAGFVCQGLCTLPGVSATALCHAGRLVASTGAWDPGEVRRRCDAVAGRCEACLHEPPGATRALFPMRTASADQGQLGLLLDGAGTLTRYAPYLQNVANVVAVSIENRLQQRRLLELNEALAAKVGELERAQVELQDSHRMLESTVEARTAELRTANASLRESEARLLLAQEAANLGVWEYDLGSRTLRTAGSLQDVLGTGAGDGVAVARLYERVHPEDLEPLRSAVARAVAERTAVHARLRIEVPGLGERWILVQGRPEYGPSGAPTRVLGVDLDVTEQRRLEEEVLQASKLESLGRLAGGVAHDLNNLLTVILGSSDAARQSPADAEEYLGDVVSAAGRAVELTRQLLAFARRQTTRPRPVDVNVEVQTLARLLGRLIGEHVELHLALDPHVWAVSIDPGHLGQVLTNLVTNARDAMPRGGRVSISTRNVSGGGHAPDAVAIEVLDTGSGMGPDVLAHVFEPFYTTKAVGRGTGLGLASSFGLVAQAGGRITVESEVGRGSRFTVLLPRASGPVTATEPTGGEEHARRGSETILLVDDDAQVRRVAARALLGLGYRVLEASSASAALELARRHAGPIDALVTDVVMPGASGPELATALRASRAGLRCLFVSGYPSEPLPEDQAFLQKPFTGDQLARRIRALLDGAG